MYRYGEYLGYIDVKFDHVGKVVRWTGGPIHLTNQTAQDTALQSQIETWRVLFDAFGNDLVGNTTVLLDSSLCKTSECNFGDLICDVMINYRERVRARGVRLNGGGIRIDSFPGEITRADAIVRQ
ncbi:hypothetical protein GGX14DRAFT_622203 [Mycena pura]|uniref:5'-Nucleotidase C-terminal domain-containing protein n=1 Tax=Mycena pura TaxID=153505 RepID=A0AAD6VJW6_9AGAR|nr:hypothetical protein GGX14DRAFT_622203 [Mycena pura]